MQKTAELLRMKLQMGWDYLAGVSLKDYLEVFRFLEGIGKNHIQKFLLEHSYETSSPKY